MTKLLLILGLLVGIFLPGESLAQENKSNFVHVSLVDRMQQDSKTECISDSVLSFGGGDIIQGEDGRYHLFVSGWVADSARQDKLMPDSMIYQAISEKPQGPYKMLRSIGAGCHPEVFKLADNSYMISVQGGYYSAKSLEGLWTFHTFGFDSRNRPAVKASSHWSLARRKDNSFLMVSQEGGVWVSQSGVSTYNGVTDEGVFPLVATDYDDWVVWRDNVQYHLLLGNHENSQCYYMRSLDGLHWVIESKLDYSQVMKMGADSLGLEKVVYGCPSVLQNEEGKAIQLNLEVTQVRKDGKMHSRNVSFSLEPDLDVRLINKKPITDAVQKLEILVKGNDRFNPLTDLDLPTLRAGSPLEVNRGGGGIVVESKPQGKDLLLTFYADFYDFPHGEFAVKLAGKKQDGTKVTGYMRLPQLKDNPLMSVRKPIFANFLNKKRIKMTVENLGDVSSRRMNIYLKYKENGKYKVLFKEKLPPLRPFEVYNFTVDVKWALNDRCRYEFVVVVDDKDYESEYHFVK